MVSKGVAVFKKSKPSVSSPTWASDLLRVVLRKYGLQESFLQYQAMYAFTQACGPWLSRQVRAERLSRGVLYVRVSHSTWTHEIESMKEGLLQRLHALPGGTLVRRLRFVVGPLGDLPDWADAEESQVSSPVLPSSSEEQALWEALQQVPEAHLYNQIVALYQSVRENKGK